jgi:hypothetical protein
VADLPQVRVVVGRTALPVVPMNWLDRLYNENVIVHYVVLGLAFIPFSIVMLWLALTRRVSRVVVWLRHIVNDER